MPLLTETEYKLISETADAWEMNERELIRKMMPYLRRLAAVALPAEKKRINRLTSGVDRHMESLSEREKSERGRKAVAARWNKEGNE